jgi:hypothetical protein
MDINCEQVAEKYLLNQNPLYAFSFPLSILIAIIVFGISKAYELSDNSYINQILIPILVLLLSMVLIDFVSRYMISSDEKDKIVNICKSSNNKRNEIRNNDDMVKNIHINISNKKNKDFIRIENFTIQDNTYNNKLDEKKENIKPILNKIQENNVETPICEMKSLSPFPLQFKKNNSQCIRDSDCYNLCSGTNSNPYNLIAPIPGPQWLPQSAEAMQNRLKNNDYTPAKCVISS